MKKFLNRLDPDTALVVLAAIVIVIVCALTGCAGTVTPHAVAAAAPSYDVSEQTSGVLATVPGGFILSSGARDRYNALIAVYGHDAAFLPPLVIDAGIKPVGAAWFIDLQHYIAFAQMAGWRRAQTHAPKTFLQKAIAL